MAVPKGSIVGTKGEKTEGGEKSNSERGEK